jgi:hypothetical protein
LSTVAIGKWMSTVVKMTELSIIKIVEFTVAK